MLADAIPLQQIRRALVIKLRHHGDVLLSSPVFSVLKQHAPDAEIDALVYTDTADMLSLHPAISQLHGIDRDWKRLGPLARAACEWQLLQTLRHRRYDLVIHLTEHWRGAWLVRLLGPRWSVAPEIAARGERWSRRFTHLYGQPRNALRHVVEANLDALRRIGIQPAPEERRLALVPGPEAETQVAVILEKNGLEREPFIHVHPASRWFFKCWPVASMAALIGRLQDSGQHIVMTSAPTGEEMAMAESIVRQLRQPIVSLAGQLSLKELAALDGRAKLFIGVDSAPMHIAAAMGTPTVALFGPSGDKQWGPWGVPNRVVASRTHPCRPCGIDGCGGSKVSDCLVRLGVDEVYAAARELL
jgi:heptosyltransferase-3